MVSSRHEPTRGDGPIRMSLPTGEERSPHPVLSCPALFDRKDLPWVASAVLMAIGLRILWIAYVNVDPNDGRFTDSVFFHNTAYLLASGHGYIEPYGRELTAQWPPGYPATLALVYKLFGWHLILAKVLNICFAAVTVVLTYLAGRRIFGQPVAYGGAIVLGLFPGQIFFSALVFRETMFAMVFMLVLLMTLVWSRGHTGARWWQLLLIGALIGVAGMVRAEGVLLAFVLVAFWALTVRPWRRVARYGAVMALGATLALTPWTVRNAVQLQEFTPLSSNPTGVITRSLTPDRGARAPRFGELVEATLKETVNYQLTHPWEVPELVGRKIAKLYQNDSAGINLVQPGGVWFVERVPDDDSGSFHLVLHRRIEYGAPPPVRALSEQEASRWRWLADRYFFSMGAAALAGAVIGLRSRNRASLLLIVTALGWTLLFGFIPPSPRFHFALGPVISILAAASLVYAWTGARTVLDRWFFGQVDGSLSGGC